MKKILIIIIALVVVGGVVYFVINKKPREQGSKDIVSEGTQERDSLFEGLPEGVLEDLVINKKVMVTGTTNSDGSITAQIIFIGEFEEGFQGMRDFSSGSMMASARPIRNLSQEERMERMQEFSVNSEGNHMGGMMNTNTAFIRGEIINKDEVSITVKLIDSGSRLIFYSDDTQIRIQK